jgi:hypothetical protein
MINIGNAKTFGDAAYQLAANPRATFTMLVDSLAISIPMMGPALALGPAGAVARGATAGIGSGGLEYGSAMADVLQEKGVNLLDPVAIERALRNPKIMAEIKEVGAKQGLIVGGFDALTAGLAGRFMRPAKELIRAGQLTGSAARNATVSAWAKELAVQIAGGAGGEAAKQKIVKGEITKPADVLLEGLAEGISSPLEVRSALREAKELQAGRVPGTTPPAAPTKPTEYTIGEGWETIVPAGRKEPVFREEGAPPPPPPPAPTRDIEAEAKRINKMGIPMSEARRIAESVGRTPENALPPVDTWPDAAVRATLEFQLNKPEEERNEELVNLLQAEVTKRGPISEAQQRIADVADEFIAAGVPPLEARQRAEAQIKEQDEADALAEAEATKGEQPSAEGLQTLLTNIANEYVTYAKLSPEEALERARGLIRDKYGADALARAEATKGEQRDTGTVVTPSGEGAGVAGVSDTGVPPGGPSGAEPSGVVPTSEDAGQPPAGEATEPAPLEEKFDPIKFAKDLLVDAEDQQEFWGGLQNSIDTHFENLRDTMRERGITNPNLILRAEALFQKGADKLQAAAQAAEEARVADARDMASQYVSTAFDQRNDHESLQEAIDSYRENLAATLVEQGKRDYIGVAIKAFDEAVKKQSKTTPPTLRITKYDDGGFGLDWLDRGIPAIERVFETEEEARDIAARRFAGEHVADGVYTWDNATQTAIPPAPTAAEAPKKRGRPPLTEEQRKAKAATQQPAGKRGRKPLTEEEKAEKKKQNAPERATLAQIVRAVDKLTERVKNALTPVNEDAFETDEEVAQAEEDKRVERKDVIRELLKHEANPIVRGRPLHKRIKDLLNSPGITEQEKADIKKGMELVSKVNLREETLPAAGKAASDPVDSAFSKFTTGLAAIYHIIKNGNPIQKAIASRLRNSVNNIKFVVIEKGDELPPQLKTRRNAEQWERSRALYIENYKTRTRTIYVRGASFGESQGANNTTVLHELLHGATNYKIALAKEYIDKGIHLDSRLVKSFERLIEIMNFAGYKFNELETVDELPEEISALANYGDIFDDPREFVAYGMTDERMQQFLQATEGFDEDTYLFPKFVQVIRGFFGFKESEVNALSDLMLAVHNLMEAPEEATPLEDTSTQISAQAKRSAEEIDDAVRKAKEVVAQSRAGEEARGVKLMQLARDPKRMLKIFPALWRGAKNAQRELLVRLPTFDFLAKWMGKDVPMLLDINKNFQNMTGMAEEFRKGASEMIAILQLTFKAEPDQRRKVENLVYESTIARIDPSLTAAQERSPDLDAAYRALSPAGKEAYKLMREYYERVHDLYRLLLDDQISNLEGISEEAKEKLMATIRLAYEGKESIKPYFPLVRRGEFWVATGTGPNRQFFMFEKEDERDTFKAQLKEANPDKEFSSGNSLDKKLRDESYNSSAMLKEIFEAIDSQELDDPGVKEGIKDAIYQIYLQTMPEQSFRKMFKHRKDTAGFSTDLVRNTATTASKMALQLARLKYAPILRNNLIAAKSLGSDRPEFAPVVREAERRVALALSGQQGGYSEAIAGIANKTSYLWYLSSASSALIQPFSVFISGLPILGANHGDIKGAALEIGRAMTFINQYGITRRNLNGSLSYLAPSIANNTKLPADEREAVRQMTARGVQDSTYASLVWGYSSVPSADLNNIVGKGKAAANLLVGGLMHHTERLSREALYIASYRLGKKRGLTNDEAIDQAVSDVNEALGDYNITNRPRFMQKGIGRIAFQFKMFPLQMTLLALTSLKQMFTHLDAEGRKAAATKFFGLMFTSAMIAGVSNMLFFSPIVGLLGWAWKEFGDDDDLPEELKDKDPIVWFRTVFLPKMFGHISIGGVSLADIIDRGPINAATGLDVGSRTGLDDLWGRDSKDMKTARESLIAFVLDHVVGPTGSLVVSMADAYEAFALGDYQKAIEKASPSVIRNIVVANRYAEEGVESSRGSVLVPKEALTNGELFGQILGFRPDRVAAAQGSAFKLTGVEQRVQNERNFLLKQLNLEHRKAQKTDNYDRFNAIIADKLPEFNSKNPENAITAENIYDSILKRAELRASERAGIAITEKNARLMRESAENMEKLLERK